MQNVIWANKKKSCLHYLFELYMTTMKRAAPNVYAGGIIVSVNFTAYFANKHSFFFVTPGRVSVILRTVARYENYFEIFTYFSERC